MGSLLLWKPSAIWSTDIYTVLAYVFVPFHALWYLSNVAQVLCASLDATARPYFLSYSLCSFPFTTSAVCHASACLTSTYLLQLSPCFDPFYVIPPVSLSWNSVFLFTPGNEPDRMQTWVQHCSCTTQCRNKARQRQTERLPFHGSIVCTVHHQWSLTQ